MFQNKFSLAVVFALYAAGVQGAFARDFCVGDKVMDGHKTYQITAVYADGTADISGTNGNFNVPTRELNWNSANLS